MADYTDYLSPDTQYFDDGSSIQTLDDGSTIVTDSSGNISSTPPTTGTSTPPPGAVGKDPTGKNWVNSIGQILGPVAISALTPTLNNLQSGGLLNRATNMLTNAGNAVNQVQAPDLIALIPQLQYQVQQGIMTPAQATAALQQASQMAEVQTDQGSLNAQRAALARLGDIGTSGGMTEADRAALNATMNQTNANVAQQRAAQIQQLQMQGNAGTGTELAARLSGVQGGANANAMAGASNAQAAQARALQALQANLAGNANLNTQQFEQAAQKAKAQDVVNQFNANAQNTMALNNAQNTQASNLANFNMANTIAGTNTGIANTQAMMPYNAAQANVNNQLGVAKAQSAAQLEGGKALGTMATKQIERSGGAGVGQAANQGQPTTQRPAGSTPPYVPDSNVLNGLGGLIGQGISAVGDWLSDETLKTDKQVLSDGDVDGLMAKMTGYKYRYKGKGNPEVTGVMAQDMPQDSVVDTPAGKMIQKPEAMSQALAILANQHERIKRLEGNK